MQQVPVQSTSGRIDRQQVQPVAQTSRYSDDEDLGALPAASTSTAAVSAMSITILCERATVNANAQQTVTAVVSVKAPSSEDANDRKDSAPRGGVDIVAVMDMSGSIQGPKITTLRQTLLAAIDLLGPADRLSLIAFESSATRLIPLTRMTDAGRRTAREAVVRLNAGDGTDISAALETSTHWQ